MVSVPNHQTFALLVTESLEPTDVLFDLNLHRLSQHPSGTRTTQRFQRTTHLKTGSYTGIQFTIFLHERILLPSTEGLWV